MADRKGLVEIGIMIHVTLNLCKPSRDNQQVDLELPDGAKVRDLCDRLELAEDELVAVLKQGYLITQEESLEAGDDLQIYPMIQGG